MKLFNSEFKDLKISDDNAEHIIQGSMDEDSGTRWMQHFYDPVYNRGLVLGKQWMNSKEWAQNTKAQGGNASALAGLYFGSPEDYSWDRAIYDYAWGNQKRGFEALGHTLHLLEDAAVPDHTRNDPHPPYLNLGSPYEDWTKRFDRQSFKFTPGDKPILLGDLGSYFNTLANYSNNNFFSKDTILSQVYSAPRVAYFQKEKLSNGLIYSFAYSTNNHKLFRSDKELEWRDTIEPKENKLYLQDHDNLILSDYWSLLSKQAVLHGAGAVKLFFDEVEKEKQTKTLYEKNRPWAGKLMDKTMDKIKGLLSSPAAIIEGVTDKTADSPTSGVSPSTPDVSPRPDSQTVFSSTLGVSAPTPSVFPSTAPLSRPQPPPPLPPPSKPKDTSPDMPIAGAGGPPPQKADSSTSGVLPSTPDVFPSADTTAPDVSLTISECGQSFSNDGCLIATTTLNISWSSAATDLHSFEITINGVITNSTTTSTSTAVSDNATTTVAVRAKDTAGNWSSVQTQTVTVATRPVVINEVAWAGTSASRDADEWIELYNPTSQSVSLSGWVLRSATDNSPYINLSSTTLAAGGFFLLERTDQNTISDITANQTYTGALVNDGEVLELSHASTTMDKTPEISVCSGWCGGAAGGQYYSMERYDPMASGTDSSNWGSWQGFLGNGKNADNAAINGTPGKRNSLNYLITKNGSSLTENKTLKKSTSPYIISGGYTVTSGTTLTVESGVVIKFLTGQPSLTVNGVLKAEGTSADKIVFTAIKDDDYGGDTNQDVASTTPSVGDWASIKIAADGSVFDYAIVRYGGQEDLSGNHWANIRVETASTTIKNSTIEKSKTYGIWFKNSSGGTISGNTIKNNDRNVSGETPGTGLQITNSSPTVSNNQFTQNTKALVIESSSAPTVS
ncbi:MAG: lamin tail domain-containing protein, partial [Candidatus Sungbacteria bacterium]|nr:lamin tail domain-containing protein [Candidatus Sungbacteria bacterium]